MVWRYHGNHLLNVGCFNTGFEVFGFALLFISALAIGLWAILCHHYGILLLQFFYATAGIVGVWRWF